MTPRDREALGRIVDHIEKARSIGSDTLAAAPEVDWVAAKGMRTIIAHECEDLDGEVVAATVREDLPGMK